MMSNFDLGTFSDLVSMLIDPCIHRGFLTREAHCLDLLEFLCPGKQVFASLEGFALEIGAESVTQNRNIEFVAHQGQLEYLGRRQELCFVHQNTIDGAHRLGIANRDKQVRLFDVQIRIGLQANPRRDETLSKPIVQLGTEKEVRMPRSR